MNKVCIGDQVRWKSALGEIYGDIISIDLSRNARGDLVPWLITQYRDPRFNRLMRVRLCGLENNLAMMKFEVTFREVESA